MAQRINPFVAQKISEFVGEGMTDVQEVKRAFKHYVNSVLCAQNPPSPDDCAYFPVPRDLISYLEITSTKPRKLLTYQNLISTI